MAVTFEHGGSARAVLAAIVDDPDLGPAVLSHPPTLFSLLSEYLPDSPHETGPLLAAAQVDIPGTLRDLLDDGLTRRTAIQEAASDLAARTSFPDQACLWAVSEFALALGLAPSEPKTAIMTDSEFWQDDGPRRRGSYRSRSGRSPALRIWLAAMSGAAVVIAGAAVGIVLLSHHHVIAQQPAHPDHRHGQPGNNTVSPGPSTAGVDPASANGRPSPGHTARHHVRAANSRPSAASPAPASPTASPAPADPASVAQQFIADVNERDWPSLWQIGGGNIALTYQSNPGPLTYSEMVATFRQTVSVTITSLTAVGDAVTMHVNALDSAGVTQYYELKLVIAAGHIVSGSQYFLGP